MSFLGIGKIWTAIGKMAIGSYAIGTAIQGMIVSYAFGRITEAFADEPNIDLSNFAKNIKTNSQSNSRTIPVIYGESLVGGTEWRAISGANNERLHRVLVLGEGEIESVEKVFLNDKDVTQGDYATLVGVEKKFGTLDQTPSSTLTSVEGWDATSQGKGIAYIAVAIDFDSDVFASGLPTLTALVKGKKVYDPRLDSTQTGGSGSHRTTDTSTWEWSENPALCILDYLTNTIYGRAIPYTDIDLESFMTEANYCDETVTHLDSNGNELTGQKRYTCNGVINTTDNSMDVIKKLLTSCRGCLLPPSEKFKLVIDKPSTSVLTITEDEIIDTFNVVGASVRMRRNRAKTKFVDKHNNYEAGITITSNENETNSHLEQDNNRILEANLSFPFTNEQIRVDILNQHFIKQSRLSWKCSFSTNLRAFKVEAMDVIRIKHSKFGWDSGDLASGKLFRVTKVVLEAHDLIKIEAEEYDSSVYTYDLNTPQVSPVTNLPDPLQARPPQAMTLDSTDELLISKDGSVVERIKATWTPPAFAFVRGYEIGWKVTGTDNWTTVLTNDNIFFCSPVNSRSTNSSGAVIHSGSYNVRVRTIMMNGRRSSYYPSEDGQQHDVVGKTAKPASPSLFTFTEQADGTREFTFSTVEEPDVIGYIIKFRTQSSSAIDFDSMTSLHSGVITQSPFETKLLATGTYDFAIKAVDSSGNESENSKNILDIFLDETALGDIIKAFYPRLLGWETVGSISNGSVNTITNTIEGTAGTNAEWDDLGTTTWDNWDDFNFGSSLMVYQTNEFDLGSIITFKPRIQATGQGTITNLITFKQNSGDTYPTAVNVNTLNEISARFIKTTTQVVGIGARLDSLSILCDGKQIVESLQNVDTSAVASAYDASGGSTAGHIYLPLNTSFNTINVINVTFIGGGSGRSFEVISKTTTVGGILAPEIKLYSGSTLTDATVDIEVRGF
mgnify:CR=1 FL=1|tara:strand:- start:2127 stop:4985 length:2859 start_codon:yes stop_codon:yes gene_type:complete